VKLVTGPILEPKELAGLEDCMTVSIAVQTDEGEEEIIWEQ